MTTAHPLDTENFILSEGPTWDAAGGRVGWVDIEAGRILSAPWSDGEGRVGVASSISIGEYVGCAVPLAHGRALAALTRQLAIVDADGTIRRSRELVPQGSRFNDGKVDPAGRLVVGTLGLGIGEGGWDHLLMRLEFDGTMTILDDDLGLSNGLGWSPDGTTFYSIDTHRNTVFRREYDLHGTNVGVREEFLVLSDGHPDGMTVDVDGNLWIAIWGGNEVRCYDASGRRVHGATISVDAPHVSSVEFAGPELDRLVITTSTATCRPRSACAGRTPVAFSQRARVCAGCRRPSGAKSPSPASRADGLPIGSTPIDKNGGMAELLALCRVDRLLPDAGTIGVTAIDKRPVDQPLRVRPLGLYGDVQADRKHHGGPTKALYAYADEDARVWADALGRDIPPGLFGENLRTAGLDVSGAEIGERWTIGDELVVEVTCPRMPCATFQRRMGEPKWVKRFTEAGMPGAYLRIVRSGTIAPGDPIEAVASPGHGVTIASWFTGADARQSVALDEAERSGAIELVPEMREAMSKAFATAS